MKKIVLLIVLLSNIAAYSQTQALNQLVYEIRDPQTDRAHFRQALEKIGEYLALETMEELTTEERTVETLTGVDASHTLVNETPVLVTILRAGLPLTQGVHNVFLDSEVGFFGMERNEETLQASVDYVALPDMKDRCVILSDPMLATGGSLLNAIRIIERYQPKKIIVLVAIAAEAGIEAIHEHNPDIKIFAAAVDPILNEKGYIVPGLGDAGDRCYGEKHWLQE